MLHWHEESRFRNNYLTGDFAALLLASAPGFGEMVAVHVGELSEAIGVIPHKVAETPPREWQKVRVDLWDALKNLKEPINIRTMFITLRGGPAAYDQIVLSRTEADLRLNDK